MKIGYYNDYTGACRKVRILNETTDGKYVVELDNYLQIISKAEVMDIKEIEEKE